MTSNYIPMGIIGLLILILLMSAVLAFMSQKNGWTISFIVGTLLVGVFFTSLFYISIIGWDAYMSNDQDRIQAIQSMENMIQIIGFICPFIFLTGLIGYMSRSRSIYEKSRYLKESNLKLEQQLNQL